MWGKVVLFLKEKKYIALEVACGDILDIKLQNNVFTINSDEKYIYDVLMKETNFEIIKDAFTWQGFYGEIKINRKYKQSELQDADLEKLKVMGVEVREIK